MPTRPARSTDLRSFRALPAYLGGKRRLCPLICSLLADELPRREWPRTTFLDPCSGGGAVALYAKAQGFRVVASDLAERAAIVGRALVANSSERLRREDVLHLYAAPPGDDLGAVPAAGAFTPAQTRWLAGALAAARRHPEPRRSLLLLLVLKLVLRSVPMSLPAATDAPAAASGDYDRISPRRLGHYLRARRLFEFDSAWRVAQDVNAGVFGGRGHALRGDARAILAATPADVVYLDPPYASTSRYEHAYAALDALLGDAAPPGRPPPTLDELLDASAAAPLLVLSYGGPTLTLEELVALVRRHRPVRRALAVPYPHLRSIATEEKNRDNREYLVVAGR